MPISATLKRVLAITIVLALTLVTNAAIGYAAKTGAYVDVSSEVFKSGASQLPSDTPRPTKSGASQLPSDTPRPTKSGASQLPSDTPRPTKSGASQLPSDTPRP
jgi:hypothetical protein